MEKKSKFDWQLQIGGYYVLKVLSQTQQEIRPPKHYVLIHTQFGTENIKMFKN